MLQLDDKSVVSVERKDKSQDRRDEKKFGLKTEIYRFLTPGQGDESGSTKIEDLDPRFDAIIPLPETTYSTSWVLNFDAPEVETGRVEDKTTGTCFPYFSRIMWGFDCYNQFFRMHKLVPFGEAVKRPCFRFPE
ncbi:hypothetical protein V8G54_017439 [Vigna mungo]|uniref:Uncharacterized protein n=1 Tax=Vigna mungo TaxID=3915 RepID=A0AAQ3RYQ7_VIGMU